MPTAACALATLLLACALTAAPADARVRAPHVSWVKCMRACTDKRTVAPRGTVKVAGRRFSRGSRVMFPVRRSSGKRAMKRLAPRSRSKTRIIVKVPSNARSGRLYVVNKRGKRSNRAKTIRVRKLPSTTQPPTGTGSAPPPTGTAFDGNGMWIWELRNSNGGDPEAIVAQARAHDISTVFVKSGDGTNYWSQFSPSLVSALKAGGLRVCAWQYVYARSPSAEASVAARAVTDAGADCFVIDAEVEYQGKYSQAQTYVKALRAKVGDDYPLGLAAFPYVDYHGSFPYSVFLGPGGAQFNAPQVYWKEIGGGVDAVVDHTYRFNRPYGRALMPLGQTYDKTPAKDIVRFRQLAAAEGSSGLSWWSWQASEAYAWNAVGQPIGPASSAPAPEFALLARGSEGDLVIWAQQLLKGAGQSLAVDGDFGPGTQGAVSAFQSDAGLPATGKIDTATWQALLQHPPAATKWASRPGGAPKTAKLPARRYEIPPGSGRGAQTGSAGWSATP